MTETEKALEQISQSLARIIENMKKQKSLSKERKDQIRKELMEFLK